MVKQGWPYSPLLFRIFFDCIVHYSTLQVLFPKMHQYSSTVFEAHFAILLAFPTRLCTIAIIFTLSGTSTSPAPTHCDCKGPYSLTGPLLACAYSTQHWGATQYTHNHVCSRTVYVLHTRVVTFGGNQYWFQMLNKWTFTMVLGEAFFWFSSIFVVFFLFVQCT